MSSHLIRLCVGLVYSPICCITHSFCSRIPGQNLDIHILRTWKQNLIVMLLQLEAQYGLCRATESIQEVIRALNLTMRDVEEAWRVWRHNYVRATLHSGIFLPFPSHMTTSLNSSSGFIYIKARIRAACWRRHQGRSPAAFVGYQSLYPAFRYAETSSHDDQSWGFQAEGGILTQQDEVAMLDLGVGDYGSLTQLSEPQRQFTPAPSHTSTHAVPQQCQVSSQNTFVAAWDYPPPSYPPPHGHQQQQQPPLMPNVNAVPATGSPPVSPAVVAAVEVATRFLEAVNKAVNICIELNAM